MLRQQTLVVSIVEHAFFVRHAHESAQFFQALRRPFDHRLVLDLEFIRRRMHKEFWNTFE